jgi:hypothetical protein
MIDEQLRKKICEQEEKKRTQQTPDIQIAKPKIMKLKCTDTNEEQNMQSNEIIEIELLCVFSPCFVVMLGSYSVSA